jgi:Fic-DOC domain mobile mystery protein B
VATRADLNRVELESITRSLPPLLAAARSGGPHTILEYGFMTDVHRRMFADVWRWAGALRRRETNIGVEPRYIAQRSVQAIDDARYWHDEHIYPPDDLAARLHAILVDIHPFPNGNGRATRLMADLYLTSIGQPIFTWGGTTIDQDGSIRRRYLDALLEALMTGDYSALINFARSS